MADKIPEFEIQKAIYDRINGNIACQIYDEVPQNPKYPFIEIGEILSDDFSSKGVWGMAVSVALHAWDRAGSNKNIIGYLSDAMGLITTSHSASVNFLSLTNFTVCNQFYGGIQTLKDIDGQTRHAILRVEIYVTQN